MALTTKQARAISALLDPAYRTNEQVAAAASVSRRTLQGWLSGDPDFQAALRDAEQELVSSASRGLLSLVDGAISALSSALDDETKYSLRAAELVLSHVLRWRETLEFEQRLAALESTREST